MRMYSLGGYGVKPPTPKSVAARFLEQSANGQNSTKLDDPVTAGESHTGWAVSAPNSACVTAWRHRLHELGASARTAAGAITESMNDYVGTDTSIAEALRKGADALEGA